MPPVAPHPIAVWIDVEVRIGYPPVGVSAVAVAVTLGGGTAVPWPQILESGEVGRPDPVSIGLDLHAVSAVVE